MSVSSESNERVLLTALGGARPRRQPVWLMRQAGRYLPEYRQLRQQARDFLSFCYTPELAVEATMQPLQRFDLDAAIIFADILTVPDALGCDVAFMEGKGPKVTLGGAVMGETAASSQLPQRLRRLRNADELEQFEARLQPVAETMRQVKQRMAPHQTAIGFCGAPWTVATYMIEGGSIADTAALRRFALANEQWVDGLIDLLTHASQRYLLMQARAGAEVLQIFDSWCSLLSARQFARWVERPTRAIVDAVRGEFPAVRIIGFPRLAGDKYQSYKRATGVDAVGFDETVSIEAVAQCGELWGAVQGAVDPQALVLGGDILRGNVLEYLVGWQSLPHIVNLGHGVTPQTPPDHVEELIAVVRSFGG